MTNISTSREELIAYLDGPFTRVPMDIREQNVCWHITAKIPNEPGWYLIETTVPVELLRQQRRTQGVYTTKAGNRASVKHYDLAARSSKYSEALEGFFAGPIVYSGMASSLQGRAREHTKANRGTGALSLHNYEPLKDPKYQWWFHYATLSDFSSVLQLNKIQQGTVLRFGEQIWRARNGWPVLCAE